MDVKDYSQKANQIKERYQDIASDLRSSTDRETENVKTAADNKIKKQAAAYADQKAILEETAKKNNEFYTEKTRDTIAKQQGEFLRDKSDAVEKFDQNTREMRQQYQEKLGDVTGTYQRSAKEKEQLHQQSKDLLRERFAKTQNELQGDYNSKVNDFSKSAQKDVQDQKSVDGLKRERLSRGFQNEIEDLRAKSQDKNFKQVARLNEDNEKLRISFDRERESSNEQQTARIDDVLKNKNIETAENQENFDQLRKKISNKETSMQEEARLAQTKQAKNADQKYNDDIKSIQKLANQKIKNSGGNEALIADKNRMQNSYETRLENLRKNMQSDMVTMTERENSNNTNTKEQLSALKSKYNEERELSDREKDSSFHKSMQKLNDKNVIATDILRESSKTRVMQDEGNLDTTKKLSKNLLKNQRVEFGKVVNTINEKNNENVNTIKDSYAKDRSKFVMKTQKELTDEKIELRAKLNHKMALQEELSNHKLIEVQKVADKNVLTTEAKLEQAIRQNDKDLEMFKAIHEDKLTKLEQAARYESEVTRLEHTADINNIRSRYEKIIDRDRLNTDLQTNKIVQKYEDQIERERMAHQKEINMRSNESHSQVERLYKGFELDKEAMRAQFEDRVENMKLSASEQANSKKA